MDGADRAGVRVSDVTPMQWLLIGLSAAWLLGLGLVVVFGDTEKRP